MLVALMKIEICGLDSNGMVVVQQQRFPMWYTAANATTNNGTARLTIGTAGISIGHDGTLHTDAAYNAIGMDEQVEDRTIVHL